MRRCRPYQCRFALHSESLTQQDKTLYKPSRQTSPEEDRTRTRAVNLHVTGRAMGVLCIQIMLRTQGLNSADSVIHAVTRETELRDGAEP